MQAVVLTAARTVEIKIVPIPEIKSDTDVVVKVQYAGLCGSDLHYYRGHQPLQKGQEVMLGHEFIGTVWKVGSAVKDFKVGDVVNAPFTCQCGSCFYCVRGYTSRCDKVLVYGTPAFTGVQAEYAYVPFADTTLVKIPEGISPQSLILMADILPTATWTTRNAFRLLGEPDRSTTTCLVLGCGPVGLCAIVAATHYFGKVYAMDPVASRRAEALKYGATLAFSPEDVAAGVAVFSDGRGVDACLEVVGRADALDLAISLIRPFGAVASCGVHSGHDAPTDPVITRQNLYNKNISLQMGRCPVRAVFKEALEILKQHDDLFSTFIQHTVPMSKAPEYYAEFEANRIGKTIFIPGI